MEREWICSTCSHRNREEERYCANCGAAKQNSIPEPAPYNRYGEDDIESVYESGDDSDWEGVPLLETTRERHERRRTMNAREDVLRTLRRRLVQTQLLAVLNEYRELIAEEERGSGRQRGDEDELDENDDSQRTVLDENGYPDIGYSLTPSGTPRSSFFTVDRELVFLLLESIPLLIIITVVFVVNNLLCAISLGM